MKKYNTRSNIAASFQVTHASHLSSGYGHKKIMVDIIDENGNQKSFSSVTSNMPDFDEATDLEGQEKYEALFELIENDIEGSISGWIYSNQD